MKNILLLLVVILLNARENPFIPVVTNNNKNLIKKTLFKDIKTNLPSDARVLKSVTFTYQTLTGEIKHKTIKRHVGPATKRMVRFLYKDGELREISKAEYKNLRGGVHW